MVDDINGFNKKLMEYLIWYNTKKPHRAINKLTPLRYYMNMVIKDSFKSNMLNETGFAGQSDFKCFKNTFCSF